MLHNLCNVGLLLNTANLFGQVGGFSIEVSNSSASTVMVGVRILVGSQSIERAPSYIEIFGRTMQASLVNIFFFMSLLHSVQHAKIRVKTLSNCTVSTVLLFHDFMTSVIFHDIMNMMS